MRLRELSIIQYQNVSKNPDTYRLWLSIDSFQKQIEYLTANKFQLLSIDDAIHYMERKKRIENGRPISLTFDNGYQDFYENVFPILAQSQYPATILISPSKVGKSVTIDTTRVDHLSWSTLEELRKNGNLYARVEVTEQREDSSLRITFRTPAELDGYLRSRVRKMLLEGVGDTLSIDEVGKVSETYARLNEMTNVRGLVLLDRDF